jgi:hypothetical protein
MSSFRHTETILPVACHSPVPAGVFMVLSCLGERPLSGRFERQFRAGLGADPNSDHQLTQAKNAFDIMVDWALVPEF